eukprot:TRINITY_DN20141_c1_g1_i1.p1 TRINITY_DN20141_c1_g1~~TRINITY_DN20141_c1_g1_i1.p1  ORF type:complete len:226 (-),score=36.56 TRINITY_DN20141_c1_g1_i1:116-736(-)
MARFDLSMLEGKTLQKQGLHNKAVPREGAYIKMRQQVYWLALHMWLIHTKQHAVQADEGLFGSALCALITRRVFEWGWVLVRLWLMIEDVPAMSVTSELEHFMEYVFGFMMALDEAFKIEAPNGTKSCLENQDEAALKEGQVGLVPRVKHVLWSNVYSGAIPHDDKHLHELTVYVIRQRLSIAATPRGTFLMGRFEWADLPEPLGA